MCSWVGQFTEYFIILSDILQIYLIYQLTALTFNGNVNAIAKGLNPDDFVEDDEEEFVEVATPTLEEKLADASLQEIDELEVTGMHMI
jgi:hypothetical protein